MLQDGIMRIECSNRIHHRHNFPVSLHARTRCPFPKSLLTLSTSADTTAGNMTAVDAAIAAALVEMNCALLDVLSRDICMLRCCGHCTFKQGHIGQEKHVARPNLRMFSPRVAVESVARKLTSFHALLPYSGAHQGYSSWFSGELQLDQRFDTTNFRTT